MVEEQEYLSAADAARVLGITRQRVTALAHQGRLGRQVGFYYVFTREELEQYRQQPKSKGGRPKDNANLTMEHEAPVLASAY